MKMLRTLFGVLQDMKGHRKRCFSSAGSPVKNKYIMEVESKGYPSLRKCGEHDLYAEIQSYKDSCDLGFILQSFGAECPRFNPLDYDEAEKFVNDFSDTGTLGDLVNDGEAVKQFFNQLPLEVRDLFGNSVNCFARDFSSDGFLEKLKDAYGIKDVPGVSSEGDSSVSESSTESSTESSSFESD